MIQFIKNDHKIQDMRAEMFILISFHIVNQYHTKTGVFFPTKKQRDYKCDIDFIQQFIK